MKIAELTGVQLDYWVAMAENPQAGITWYEPLKCWYWGSLWRPSTDWAQGGPIIETNLIEITNTNNGWYAAVNPWSYNSKRVITADPPDAEAQTPLIAAMRAYVASKFGVEVAPPPVGIESPGHSVKNWVSPFPHPLFKGLT